MSRYIKGEGAWEESDVVLFQDLNVTYLPKEARVKIRNPPLSKRIRNFKETRLGFSKDEAIEEAERCFHCGQCNLCGNCFFFCPDRAIAMEEELSSFVINSGLCKACGICINECPRDALAWQNEGR
jgi:Pyruvate/2-oxoacid:ferredoxin oxidoreductase delta subunit